MRKISDDKLLDVVDRAYEDERIDMWGGGVAPETVADDLNAPMSVVRQRLSALAEQGELEVVHGVPPEMLEETSNKGLGPRRSYVPRG